MQNIQAVESDDGMLFEFGERPSKPGRPELMSVNFDKEHWNTQEAIDWWSDHQIYFVSKHHLGQKFPYIDFIIEDDDMYIFGCLRGTPKNDTLARFLADCDEVNSENDEDEAIASLR